MVSGSWHPGEQVEIDLGPGNSEVAVAPAGLALANGWWVLVGPGSGHFVIAFENGVSSTPDPSMWSNSLAEWGLGAPRASGPTPTSYDFRDCRMDLTPLGREGTGTTDWDLPHASNCSAGIGD